MKHKPKICPVCRIIIKNRDLDFCSKHTRIIANSYYYENGKVVISESAKKKIEALKKEKKLSTVDK